MRSILWLHPNEPQDLATHHCPTTELPRATYLQPSSCCKLLPKRMPGSQCNRKQMQPLVNKSTHPATNQEAVKKLGTTILDPLLLQFESPGLWEVLWAKINLSDGFWLVIVESGQEPNFVYKLPDHPERKGKWFVIPSALKIGWMTIPAYFCATMEATQQVIGRLLAHTTECWTNIYTKHTAPLPDNATHGPHNQSCCFFSKSSLTTS
jgi:hypothetical protein